MSWAIGFDSKWNRDIGYGVPAWCDFPGCKEVIDRGLAHVCCGQEPRGGVGCGLYFCGKHHPYYRRPTPGEDGENRSGMCTRCYNYRPPFKAKPDHPDWIHHKETDESWAEWRKERDAGRPFPEEVRP